MLINLLLLFPIVSCTSFLRMYMRMRNLGKQLRKSYSLQFMVVFCEGHLMARCQGLDLCLLVYISLEIFFYLYFKQGVAGREEHTHTQCVCRREFTHRFTSQMVVLAQIGTGQSQNLPPGSPNGWQGPQNLEHLSLLFKGQQWGVGLKAEQRSQNQCWCRMPVSQVMSLRAMSQSSSLKTFFCYALYFLLP